jgi:fatty acid desaturase
VTLTTDRPVTPVVTFTKTKPGGSRTNPTTEYSALLRRVRDEGLLGRRRGFYIGVFFGLVAALGGLVTGSLLLGPSWFQLLIAAGRGVTFTQFAFLAHETAHRQVFESGRANDVAGRVIASFIVRISYSWWMTNHSRHHANPNVLGKDPDIGRDFISFTDVDAARATS